MYGIRNPECNSLMNPQVLHGPGLLLIILVRRLKTCLFTPTVG